MKAVAQHGAIEQLTDLATRLPWWGGLLSALAVYGVLHPVAILQMPTPTGTVDVVANALGQFFILLARVGQYLLPLAFLVAAVVSGFNLWKRGELRESVALDTSGSILRGLPWKDFELLLSDAFRRLGYEVGTPRPDTQAGEKVLVLTREGRRFLVDCTDWRSGKAGAASVRGLHEHMEVIGASGGFAVTSGRFTPEAMHLAADKDIELVDGRRLKELVSAEPQPSDERSWPVREALKSQLARCRDLITTARPSSKAEIRTGVPVTGIQAETVPETGLRAVRDSRGEETAIADTTEMDMGRQLSALIRAERRAEAENRSSAPPPKGRRAHPRSPRWTFPRVRARKIADVVGMLLAGGILWGVCKWFMQLPDRVTDTPWTLSRSGSASKDLVRRMQGLSRTQAIAKIMEGGQPLGQYRFGPPEVVSRAPEPEIPVQEEEPVEVYHSLRELEAAFDAKYVPPPECYAYESNNLMVKCGNHRIRARRTFITNGGKVTPMLLGSWEEPRAVRTEIRPLDWPQDDRDEWRQDWSQGSGEDRSRYRKSEPLPVERRHWVDDL